MLSTPLGFPLATGHTAEVHAWNEGQVLKLFREWFPLRAIEHEARVARVVHAAGLPVPAVGDIVEVAGRHGIVYERVVGPSMLELLTSRPWRLFAYARLLAELQAKLHDLAAPEGVPSQHRRMEEKIRGAPTLPPNLSEAALKMLRDLPEGNRLCHGDFHPGNVLMTAGRLVLIDWIDATCGNPISDVARSSLLLSKALVPQDRRLCWLLILFREWFHAAYIRHYFRLRPEERDAVAQWRLVNAAARLSEGVPEEEALLAFVEGELRG